jgi:antirestriction protein ArdC
MNTNVIEFHQQLIADIIRIMDDEELYWDRDWIVGQQNYLTNHIYSGFNALKLSLAYYNRKYSDPRWITKAQMFRHYYEFRNPAAEKTEGITILYVKSWDDYTNKEFSRYSKPFKFLNAIQKKCYEEKYIRFVEFVPYQVYNCSLIDGIKPFIKNKNQEGRNEYLEGIIQNSFVKIYYDGQERAYYKINTDSIHLPEKSFFKSMQGFYGTAMHEIAHSTGHQSRLQRKIRNYFGDEGYAYEELVAEFSSILMQLEYGCVLSQEHIKNHAAYLQSWKKYAKEDPNILSNALSDANSAVNYIKKQYEQQNSYFTQ